mmetsp:Transcript_2638/g.8240  ORF Transcript_2638/g.8240 Transcript_2638/m.8240 type:complete len:117 (+) Transcript_2638:3384-3734(+)
MVVSVWSQLALARAGQRRRIFAQHRWLYDEVLALDLNCDSISLFRARHKWKRRQIDASLWTKHSVTSSSSRQHRGAAENVVNVLNNHAVFAFFDCLQSCTGGASRRVDIRDAALEC